MIEIFFLSIGIFYESLIDQIVTISNTTLNLSPLLRRKGSNHRGFNLLGLNIRELDFFNRSDVALAILLELCKELLQILLFTRLLVLLIDLAMIADISSRLGLMMLSASTSHGLGRSDMVDDDD